MNNNVLIEGDIKDLLFLLNGSISAGDIVCKILQTMPLELDQAKDVMEFICFHYIIHSNMDTRVNASKALHCISLKFCKSLIALHSVSDGFLLKIEEIDVDRIIKEGQPLLNGKISHSYDGNIYSTSWLDYHRISLRKRISFEVNSIDIGMESDYLDEMISYEDICVPVKGDREDSASKNSALLGKKSFHSSSESWFSRLLRYLVVGMIDTCWECRQGCSLGLSNIISAISTNDTNEMSRLQVKSSNVPQYLLEDIISTGLCVLLLDQFMDFSDDGVTAVCPVKEVVGHLIACAALNHLSFPTILRMAIELACCGGENATYHNQRVSGSVLLKYLMQCKPTSYTVELWFERIMFVVNRDLHSSDSDVIDSACQILNVLLENGLRDGADGFALRGRLVDALTGVNSPPPAPLPTLALLCWSVDHMDSLSRLADIFAAVIKNICKVCCLHWSNDNISDPTCALADIIVRYVSLAYVKLITLLFSSESLSIMRECLSIVCVHLSSTFLDLIVTCYAVSTSADHELQNIPVMDAQIWNGVWAIGVTMVSGFSAKSARLGILGNEVGDCTLVVSHRTLEHLAGYLVGVLYHIERRNRLRYVVRVFDQFFTLITEGNLNVSEQEVPKSAYPGKMTRKRKNDAQLPPFSCNKNKSFTIKNFACSSAVAHLMGISLRNVCTESENSTETISTCFSKNICELERILTKIYIDLKDSRFGTTQNDDDNATPKVFMHGVESLGSSLEQRDWRIALLNQLQSLVLLSIQLCHESNLFSISRNLAPTSMFRTIVSKGEEILEVFSSTLSKRASLKALLSLLQYVSHCPQGGPVVKRSLEDQVLTHFESIDSEFTVACAVIFAENAFEYYNKSNSSALDDIEVSLWVNVLTRLGMHCALTSKTLPSIGTFDRLALAVCEVPCFRIKNIFPLRCILRHLQSIRHSHDFRALAVGILKLISYATPRLQFDEICEFVSNGLVDAILHIACYLHTVVDSSNVNARAKYNREGKCDVELEDDPNAMMVQLVCTALVPLRSASSSIVLDTLEFLIDAAVSLIPIKSTSLYGGMTSVLIPAYCTEQVLGALSSIFFQLVIDIKETLVTSGEYGNWLMLALRGMGLFYSSCRKHFARSFSFLVQFSPMIKLKEDLIRDNSRKSILLKFINGTAVGNNSAAILVDVFNAYNTEISTFEWCAQTFVNKLRSYQVYGVIWIMKLWELGLSGVLADEMGLGKTIQALTAVALKRHWMGDTSNRPSLIVCPASVQHHWENEISRFFSPKILNPVNLNRLFASELNKAKLLMQRSQSSVITKKLSQSGNRQLQSDILAIVLKGLESSSNVLIVSYDFVRTACHLPPSTATESQKISSRPRPSPLQNFLFNVIVTDEAHIIRNPRAKTSASVFSLHGKSKLALTGTPVQNRTEEVWSLFEFVLPDYLGTYSEFKKNVIIPIQQACISKAFAKDCASQNKFRAAVNMTATGVDTLDNLHKQILPFVLRRTKDIVKNEIPPKSIVDIFCAMTTTQKVAYCKFQQGLHMCDDDLEIELSKIVASQSKEKSDSVLVLHPFQALIKLNLIGVHPQLVSRSDVDFSTENDTLRFDDIMDYRESGKMTALVKLLLSSGVVEDQDLSRQQMDMLLRNQGEENKGSSEEESSDDESDDSSDDEMKLIPTKSKNSSMAKPKQRIFKKCVIFCQHLSVMDLIERSVLIPLLKSVTFARLDGEVAPQKRHRIVDAFNKSPSDGAYASSPRILLASIGTCGLGINLTGGEIVIFVEHNWNPFVDLQAMDRCHRIGQDKHVQIYRLLAQNTIESRIMQLQETKCFISNKIINEKNSGDDSLLNTLRNHHAQIS